LGGHALQVVCAGSEVSFAKPTLPRLRGGVLVLEALMSAVSPDSLPQKLHFPGLNAIRAYAAFAVVFSHIDFNVNPRPWFSQIITPFLIDNKSAVNLFFVLSGFLITSLLLRESEIKGGVSVGKFYGRRILRIWPLYYLIVIIGTLIFPLIFGFEYVANVFYPDYPRITIPVETKIILTFLFLPNLATISGPLEHLWSIGVEEQFYLLWPWVFRKKLNIVKICAGVMIVRFMVAPFVANLNNSGMLRLFEEFRFECMAVGALGAYVYMQRLPLLKWAYHRGVQVVAAAMFVYMAGHTMPPNVYAATLTALVFIVLILNVATNPDFAITLNYPPLERLGQISYGLYLYHFPVFYVVLIAMQKIPLLNASSSRSLLTFFFALLGTWLIAEISYRWFEQPFLNLKEKFASL
jgi:peptidoglycan/LPS O-acetylase OafA/YrhL